MVTGTEVAPLRVAKAELELRVSVKPEEVGAGEAATVPNRACSRSFSFDARIGLVVPSASASTRWPLPILLALKAGGELRLSLSVRTMNCVLAFSVTSTVVGGFALLVEST